MLLRRHKQGETKVVEKQPVVKPEEKKPVKKSRK